MTCRMTSGESYPNFDDARRIARRYFKNRGFTPSYNALLHSDIARRFPLVVSNASKRIGIDLLTSRRRDSAENQLGENITRSKMISDPVVGGNLEIAVVLSNPSLQVHIRSRCIENGIGLYTIENSKLTEIVKPSQSAVEAKFDVREIQDLVSFINTKSQKRFGLKLFRIEADKIAKLNLNCKTDSDLTQMITSVATIIDSINRKAIRKLGISPTCNDPSTVDDLEALLSANGISSSPSIFDNFRLLKRLRNTHYPVHDTKGCDLVCAKLTGESRPDKDTLASCVVSRFLIALGHLVNAL